MTIFYAAQAWALTNCLEQIVASGSLFEMQGGAGHRHITMEVLCTSRKSLPVSPLMLVSPLSCSEAADWAPVSANCAASAAASTSCCCCCSCCNALPGLSAELRVAESSARSVLHSLISSCSFSKASAMRLCENSKAKAPEVTSVPSSGRSSTRGSSQGRK